MTGLDPHPRKSSWRCGLGLHRVTAVPVWNEGLYFARCARCDQDLVRTAFEKWHPPRGSKVVWQSNRPASLPMADLAPMSEDETLAEADDEAPAAVPLIEDEIDELAVASPEPELPAPSIPSDYVQETVDAVDEPIIEPEALEPLPADDATTEVTVKAPPAPSRPRSLVPDFMDDSSEGWEPISFDRVQSYYQGGAMSDREPRESARAVLSRKAGDTFRMLSRLLAATVRRSRTVVARMRALPAAQVQSAALVGIILVVLFSLWMGLRVREAEAPGQRNGTAAIASSAAAPKPAGAVAFVTIRALNCRESPDKYATVIRVLGRDEQVEVLARDGEWASLAHSKGQCWSLDRYVSQYRRDTTAEPVVPAAAGAAPAVAPSSVAKDADLHRITIHRANRQPADVNVRKELPRYP